MINVLIFEDEAPAGRKLRRFLGEVEEEVFVVAELATVAEAILFLSEENNFDLIISDIELLDGNVFNIFKEVTPSVPIIFTTAYNQFLMDAFETSGIEYLLKPFTLERFKKAWAKFMMLRAKSSQTEILIKKIGALFEVHSEPKVKYKERFAVNSHRGTSFIDVEKILFFGAEEGVVFAVDTSGKKHLLIYATLKEVELLVNPNLFFRINRSELVCKNHIERIERYSKNSISLKLLGYSHHLITSQSCTAQFREWVEQ